jgi:hypothetical protein
MRQIENWEIEQRFAALEERLVTLQKRTKWNTVLLVAAALTLMWLYSWAREAHERATVITDFVTNLVRDDAIKECEAEDDNFHYWAAAHNSAWIGTMTTPTGPVALLFLFADGRGCNYMPGRRRIVIRPDGAASTMPR